MNPYASFLGNREPLQVLEATGSRLAEISKTLGPARINDSPAPGKWGAREIITHLADTEISFAFRYRQTLAENDHVIQPFDQEKWAQSYAAYDAPSALATFRSLREWNMKLLRSLTAEQFSRTVTHPERGKMTLRTIVETAAGHDLNHLRQLEAIVGKLAA
jgi:hypothetical protein